MKPVPPSDNHRLLAAEGWLELGNPSEALAELNVLPPQLQAHPRVLALRWEASAACRDWERALEVAAAMIQATPEEAAGWFNRSFSLHELKRTLEARDNLLRVVDKFALSAVMRYNLACYECQLGRLDQARAWLEKALRLADRAGMLDQALRDPDLEPLWPELSDLDSKPPK